MKQIHLKIDSPNHTSYSMDFPEPFECLNEKQVKDLKADIERMINDLMCQTARNTRASIRHQIKQALGF